MNKLKIAFTILILAGLSLVTFVQIVAIDENEQTQIRKKLYSMDDFSGLTAKEIDQYKKIIANHIIKLEEKIEKGSRVINWNILKGTLISVVFSCCADVFWEKKLDFNYKFRNHIPTYKKNIHGNNEFAVKENAFGKDETDSLVREEYPTLDRHVRMSRFFSYIETLRELEIQNQLLLICSLFAIPTAYHYFNKAWHVKDRAKSRLLRDQGVLYQLAQVNSIK